MLNKSKSTRIDISIRELRDFEGQLAHTSSFERRVNKEYVFPTGSDDIFIRTEGLHPCAVVPDTFVSKMLRVVYKKQIIALNSEQNESPFKESIRGFEQTVVRRHIVPRKGRIYYSESSWTNDDSPEGMYPTLIFPKELVGKVVALIAPS